MARKRTARRLRPRQKLTAVFVRNVRAKKDQRPEYADQACPGLYLVVHPTGRKVYALRYRRPYGAAAKLTLGEADTSGHEAAGEPKLGGLLTLSAARVLAAQQKHLLKQRRDPGREYLEAKRQEDDEREFTFERACREFIERYAKPKNRRWRDTASQLGLTVERGADTLAKELRDGGLCKRWRHRPLSDIKKADVIRVLDEYGARGAYVAANRMHATLNKLFNWFISRDVLTANPLTGLEKHDEQERERKLSDDELVAFWRATAKAERTLGLYLRLVAVTGQRKNEVRLVRRSELRDDLLALPGSRTKNKCEHLLPLSKLALKLLREAEAAIPKDDPRRKHNDYLLLGVPWTSKIKARFDELMLAELKKLVAARHESPDKLTLEPWTLHDLRRTMASRMGDGNVGEELIERVLNHTPQGVTRKHYNQAQRLASMREAMEWWAVELRRVVGEKAS